MNKPVNNQELDSYFALNKDSYEKDFLPIYDRFGLKPMYLVQFPVILPFEIPFSPGTCATFEMENGDACTLHFSDIQTTKHVHAGIVGPEPASVPIRKSRVEMTLVSGKEISIPLDKKTLSNIFDSLVNCLNWVITAFQIYKKDTDVYQVSREMFEFGCICRTISVVDWDNPIAGLFLTNWNVPYQKEKLSKEDHQEIIKYASIIFTERNPFILSEELMLNGKRNFNNGFYKDAIIYCQSSIETFLSSLYVKFLELEGKKEDEILKTIEELPFLSMVKKEFHSRIGGKWNPDNKTHSIGNWYVNTYLLRNRIVHAGYRPSYEEAQEALKSAFNFRTEIIKLIHFNKKKYPDIVKYFHIK